MYSCLLVTNISNSGLKVVVILVRFSFPLFYTIVWSNQTHSIMQSIEKLITLLFILCYFNSFAIQINGYNSTHDRFINYPNNPSKNNDYILASYDDISSVGWSSSSPQFSMTLIHPQFLLAAYHARPAIGGTINFINNNGALKSYTVGAIHRVNDGTNNTDLAIVELTTPIPAADNINTVSIGSVAVNETVYPYGKFARTGIERITQINYPFTDANGILGVNTGIAFDYFINTAQTNEAYSEGGDSGSPTFIIENNALKIVGVRSLLQTLAIGLSVVGYRTVDICVSCYQTQIDQIISEHEIIDLAIAPKLWLKGAYDSNTGLMRDSLRANYPQELINSPYADQLSTTLNVFNTGGTDGTGNANDDIVDWVWVELREEQDNTTSVVSRSALLQRDGDVVDIDGRSPLIMRQKRGKYYIVITHRNHLGVMTATAIQLSE